MAMSDQEMLVLSEMSCHSHENRFHEFVLPMDIAVRKLEKSITLSISQNDFEIEVARVAGVHLVLLTALLLGKGR